MSNAMDTNDAPAPQAPRLLLIGLKWGLLLGLALSICQGLQMGFGAMRATWWQTAIQWLVYALLIYFGIRAYRTRAVNGLTFGRAVKVGFVITCWASLVCLVLLYVGSAYVFPEYLAGVKEAGKLAMENTPVPGNAAEHLEAVIDTMFRPSVWSLGQALNVLLTGLIFTILASIFLRQESR